MKQILALTFGTVLSLLGFSIYYGDFAGLYTLLIVSPLIVSALFTIKKFELRKYAKSF